MGMSVFNRPQAGACPVCGAPMYYRQAPILLEHDFEQYDVWASVRYCEDCGIEIMVPGEAKSQGIPHGMPWKRISAQKRLQQEMLRRQSRVRSIRSFRKRQP